MSNIISYIMQQLIVLIYQGNRFGLQNQWKKNTRGEFFLKKIC